MAAATAQWFAARTRYGQELGIRARLESLGVECFIPSGKRRNYRGKMKEHPLITNLVFIHTDKKTACALKTYEGLPVNYLFDYVQHTMLTVPDKQMEDFRRVLEASLEEGGLVDRPLAIGEKVRITEGPLRGVEGNVLELQGRLYVIVGIAAMVYAKARVPRAWLEKVIENN